MKCFIIILFMLSLNPGFGQPAYVTRLDGSKISTGYIDTTVARLMDAARIPGLSLSVINNKKAVYTKSYGYKNGDKSERLDTATVLYAASLSKSVFAFLTLQLVQEKLLALDKPLYTYLTKPIPAYTYYASLAADERWKLITARMCLSHTTGLPNVTWINVRTGEIDTLGKLQIYFTPGTRYAYSGEGLKLLQLVIEEIAKKTIEELAIERIYTPAGMTRTGFIWHDRFDNDYAVGYLADGTPAPKGKKKIPVAAGSLVTTIADFTRFIEYVLLGKGLTKTMGKLMLTPQVQINSAHQFPTITDDTTMENAGIQLSYGLGWGLLQSRYGKAFFKEGHDDAWRNYTISFVESGTSIVIICNSANGEAVFKELLEEIIGDTFTPWQWENYIPYNSGSNQIPN